MTLKELEQKIVPKDFENTTIYVKDHLDESTSFVGVVTHPLAVDSETGRRVTVIENFNTPNPLKGSTQPTSLIIDHSKFLAGGVIGGRYEISGILKEAALKYDPDRFMGELVSSAQSLSPNRIWAII